MANTCFTTYKVTGRRIDVKRLHRVIQRIEKRRTPLVDNSWSHPNLLLGCLVKALGGDPEKVYCRGEIAFYELENDILTISTETAWGEMNETRHFIESCFDGMKIYYCEEECGNEVFNTNDAEGLFFPDRFYLDSEDDLPEPYFTTIKDAADTVALIVGHEVDETVEGVNQALEDYMEANPDKWYSFHEYKVCDD